MSYGRKGSFSFKAADWLARAGQCASVQKNMLLEKEIGSILQEHISLDRSTLARSCKPIRSFKTETSFSAIGQHLLQNPTCAHEYNDNKFSILARGRTSFHLSTLEATYIKTSKPNLCKQKEFVYGLKITH